MANDYFQFKEFTIWQQHCAMKVTTDGCLFGGWAANEILDAGYLIRDVEAFSRHHALSVAANCQPSTVNQSFASAPRSSNPGHRVLDIGTGTGLLTLMVAQKTSAIIDAVEIEPAAAAQAVQNMAASPWTDRLNVMEGDITQLSLPHQYDVIISNPPFFENQLASPDEGRQKALHASVLGLQDLFIRMAELLQPQGRILLLLPAYRHSELVTLATQHNWHINKLVWVNQTPKHDPFRMMVQLSSNPAIITPETLLIKDSNQQYSPEFVALLKDYYLHL